MEHKYTTLWLILVLTTVSLTHQMTKALAKIPAIIVFGDSSVDSGNNNQISTVLKSNFQPYGRDFDGGRATGRFSNGRIPPDYISAAFGLKSEIPAYLDPAYNISDFATGVCFASAGTGYDNATSNVLNVIPLWKELVYFKEYQGKLKSYIGYKKAKEIVREALYLMSIGTNDFMENYFLLPNRRSRFTVSQYQDFLIGISANFIRELYRMGGRKLSLTGLPPMGCLPLERTTNIFGQHDCAEEYNKIAVEFNAKLNVVVGKLNRELPGMKVVTGNAYNIFYHIIRNPSHYGFEVAEIACCATGLFEMGYMCNKDNLFTCPDANKYVFWDAFHPTEKTNRIISEHIIPRLKAYWSLAFEDLKIYIFSTASRIVDVEAQSRDPDLLLAPD
ncbi:hypothetical protein ACFE04_016465 [Oxalis oulophora]